MSARTDLLIHKGGSIGLVWALSTAGTVLHLVLQALEYMLNRAALPKLKKVAECREKVFDPDGNCIEHIWYNNECKEKIRNENKN